MTVERVLAADDFIDLFFLTLSPQFANIVLEKYTRALCELDSDVQQARAKRSVCEIRKQMKNKGKRKSKLKHQAS